MSCSGLPSSAGSPAITNDVIDRPEAPAHAQVAAATRPDGAGVAPAREIGGRAGPEPTRFGDWEKGGRCIDF